jgi:hypothetical protein
VDDGGRLELAGGRLAVLGRGGEVQPDAVAAGPGDERELPRIDLRAVDAEGGGGVAERADAVARRSGRICSSVASARTEYSSMPASDPDAALRSPTATAIASASSRSSGGICAPAARR